MKILFISNSSWNLYNFRAPLIKFLKQHNHDVTCLSKEHRVKHIKLEKWGIQSVDLKNIEPRGKNIFTELRLICELQARIKEIKPDLILCFTPKINIYTGLIALILGIPVINNITGLGSAFTDKGKLPLYIRILYKLGLRNSKAVIFHNDDDRNYFNKLNIVSANNSLVINGSGIDTNYFNSYRKVTKVRKVLFSGRLIKEKGVIEFVQAAIHLAMLYPDVNWIIVGDNNEVESPEVDLELLRFQKTDNCSIFSFTNEVKKYYEETDCFILPSYREGLSKAMLEAMAMSRVIIVSNVSGCRDAIKNEVNGYLCEARNTHSIISILEKVFQLNSAQIDSITEQARRAVIENYSQEVICKRYSEVINSEIQ